MSIGSGIHSILRGNRTSRKLIHFVFSFQKIWKMLFLFLWRLPEWAEKVIEPNGTMEYIAKFDYKTYADTPQLARLKSGFLLKEILEHFSQKINSTLKPNRSVWFYSGHDVTILNMLNSLGLFEVLFHLSISFEVFDNNAICLLLFSYTFHRMRQACTLNCIKQIKTMKMSTISRSSTEKQRENIQNQCSYRNVERNAHWTSSLSCA